MSSDIHFRKRTVPLWKGQIYRPGFSGTTYAVFVDTAVGLLNPGRVSAFKGEGQRGWVIGGASWAFKLFRTRREAAEELASHIKPELRVATVEAT